MLEAYPTLSQQAGRRPGLERANATRKPDDLRPAAHSFRSFETQINSSGLGSLPNAKRLVDTGRLKVNGTIQQGTLPGLRRLGRCPLVSCIRRVGD